MADTQEIKPTQGYGSGDVGTVISVEDVVRVPHLQRK